MQPSRAVERDGHTDQEIREILQLRRIAVVGMSRDPSKAAHQVPKYLVQNGYDVIPVNPHASSILGRRSHGSVLSIDGDVDIVDIFRPSEEVGPFVGEAVRKGPKVVWLQEGIHNPEAEEMARGRGIQVVFNRCMLAEHQRLLG